MKIIISLIVGAVLGIGSLQIPAVQKIIGKSLAPQMLIEVESPLDFYDTLDKLEENGFVEKKQAKKHAVKYYRVLFPYERNDTGEIINIDAPEIKKILTPEQLRDKLLGRESEISTPPKRHFAFYWPGPDISNARP